MKVFVANVLNNGGIEHFIIQMKLKLSLHFDDIQGTPKRFSCLTFVVYGV